MYESFGEYEKAKEISALRGYCVASCIVTLCLLFWFCVFTFIRGCAFAGEVDTSRAVIHHTESHDVSAKVIDQWHKEKGWDGIGYHFVIRADGAIEKGRAIDKQGAHAKGRNDRLGIVLTGYDSFTDAQRESLVAILNDYKVKDIERHHEKCPGGGLKLPVRICQNSICEWRYNNEIAVAGKN